MPSAIVSAFTASRLGERTSVQTVDGGEVGDGGASEPGYLLDRMAERDEPSDGMTRRQAEQLACSGLLTGEHRGHHPTEPGIARRQQHVVAEWIHGRAADDALTVEPVVHDGQRRE